MNTKVSRPRSADYSAQAGRPVRLVTVSGATGAAGRSRAQAQAQLRRGAGVAGPAPVEAFAVSVETTDMSERRTVAELAAYLVGTPEAGSLAGAELVASIALGGSALPAWIDDAFRRVLHEDAR